MNIYQRIHAVMAELEVVSKERKNEQFGYRFIGHDDVMQPLRRLLVKHGIVQTSDVLKCERRADQSIGVEVRLTWTNIEEPKEQVGATSWGEACATQRDRKSQELKGDDVQIGKAISYAVKYAQVKCFCLVGGIPDNEEPEDYRKPANGAPAQREEPAPISDTVVSGIAGEYAGVEKGQKELLQKIRKSVGTILPQLTQAQHLLLQNEDTAAALRVRGES